jgi:serine/threonine-protein kinase
MSPEQPSEFEQLSPEDAAHVDAVCDRLERAWKAAQAGGTIPRLASFLEGCEAGEGTVLARELIALDEACRQRYGVAIPPEAYEHLDAAIEPPIPDTGPAWGKPGAPRWRPTHWPKLPGLELGEVLGSGGMGVVFKARQPTLDRDVAVKLLRESHLGDPEQRDRLLQEARAVARLQHPHLVRLYEFGEVSGLAGDVSQPYLVLEYVPGGSLADLLRGSPQPPEEAAHLVETLADAIHYAHLQGVIHRDLKPANILLQNGTRRIGAGVEERESDEDLCRIYDGPRHPGAFPSRFFPKVTDFGLAKFLAGGDLTRAGDVLGTPSYMAPEQTLGKLGAITPSVDVYGLGAILYEVLTGRPPFLAEMVAATITQVQQDDPIPPRRLQPTVPRDLETICLKCLRKEPGRRYATALELAEDLRRFRAGESIQARPVRTAERVVRWCRRKPVVAGLLAALVLVFVAGLSGILWQWQIARQRAVELQQERDTAQRQRERADHHLRSIREEADRLARLGTDLWHRPGAYEVGKDVLEEAVTVYEHLIPEEGSDPELRKLAAQLYGKLADIHQSLGQWTKSIQAREREANLLAGLLEEEPPSKALRHQLAGSHRARGNVLRDLRKSREARAAYDQAAGLHEQVLRDSPGDASHLAALANTLLNKATVLSRSSDAEELEKLFQRVVDLDDAALAAEPNNGHLQAERALALQDQALFFLDTGRATQAQPRLRDALAIRLRLRKSGHLRRADDRYIAVNYAYLGRSQAAAGQTEDAEQSYQEALRLLEGLTKEFPEIPYHRIDLAETLGRFADFLKDAKRPAELIDARRQAIHHYEVLEASFFEARQRRANLVRSYFELVRLLWDLGRESEADEPYRKALKLAPDDPAVNNEVAWCLVTAPQPRLRDTAEALRRAQKAVTGSPENGDYWNTLGVVRYRAGDHKGAVADLEKSMSLRQSGDSYDWFFLAMAHWRLGDRDTARQWYDKGVRSLQQHHPRNEEVHRFRAEAAELLGITANKDNQRERQPAVRPP